MIQFTAVQKSGDRIAHLVKPDKDYDGNIECRGWTICGIRLYGQIPDAGDVPVCYQCSIMKERHQ